MPEMFSCRVAFTREMAARVWRKERSACFCQKAAMATMTGRTMNVNKASRGLIRIMTTTIPTTATTELNIDSSPELNMDSSTSMSLWSLDMTLPI